LVWQSDFVPEELLPHAHRLVRIAAHREPLKLDIVLLGLAGTEDDVDDLMVLAPRRVHPVRGGRHRSLAGRPDRRLVGDFPPVPRLEQVHVVVRFCGRPASAN
jgi:hypothetical protein